MLSKAGIVVVALGIVGSAQAALALNPQPLPPGRTFRPMLNPQPLPPGRSFRGMLNPQPLPPGYRAMLNPQPLPPGRSFKGWRMGRIWTCWGVQVGDPRKQPPERVCGWR